jgi:hypothetical protein
MGHILTPSTVAALGLESRGSAPSAGAGKKIATNGYAKVREIAVGGMRMCDQTAFTLDFASKDTEGFEVGASRPSTENLRPRLLFRKRASYSGCVLREPSCSSTWYRWEGRARSPSHCEVDFE